MPARKAIRFKSDYMYTDTLLFIRNLTWNGWLSLVDKRGVRSPRSFGNPPLRYSHRVQNTTMILTTHSGTTQHAVIQWKCQPLLFPWRETISLSSWTKKVDFYTSLVISTVHAYAHAHARRERGRGKVVRLANCTLIDVLRLHICQ